MGRRTRLSAQQKAVQLGSHLQCRLPLREVAYAFNELSMAGAAKKLLFVGRSIGMVHAIRGAVSTSAGQPIKQRSSPHRPANTTFSPFRLKTAMDSIPGAFRLMSQRNFPEFSVVAAM